MGTIWVFADYRNGKILPATIENLAFAQILKDRTGHAVYVIIPGPADDAALETIRGYEADAIVVLDTEALTHFTPTAAISALTTLAEKEGQPDWILLVHTHRYYDFNPRLAVRFGVEPLTGITRVDWNDEGPVFFKEVFYGKFVVRMKPTGQGPFLVSFQPGTFSVDDARTGTGPEIRRVSLTPAETGRRTYIATHAPERKGVDLTTADIIVAVGRGIGKKENLALVQELADVLGAALGSSRPIVDAGWLPYEHQIGSSGVIVSPKLYIGIGISGAMQHTVGMKNAKVIVAINKDREAPIFKLAHFGIVEDLFKVVPALIKKAKELKEQGML